MSAEVKILIKGQTNADSVAETGEEKTQPTITLVRDGNLVMVVDPGILESQQVLIDALNNEGLTPNDIDVVCITHSHIDHYRNIGMFPYAKVLEHFGLWDKNTVQDWQEQFSPNIQILRTPGHDYTDITLFVTTDDGIVAICGDVFWKENYPKDPRDDSFASDPVKLGQSREMIFKMADWIIPGHGDMYKTNRGQMQEVREETGTAKIKSAKIITTCRKCGRPMKQIDKCLCRPWLCYNCCECGQDCNLCGCDHKR
ncbi:MAG: MBL fold metallo-hydrolase [Candidatus Staskawiczbacteria bacterium]|jgi:glyoxylase-like metal-dependent hydrolase (beta-lactamase superfamily II)